MWKFLLSSLLILHYASSHKCPKDFIKLKSKCYMFSATSETWYDAHFKCQERNSSLAMLHGRHQSEFLRQFMDKQFSHDLEERWLGGIYDWQQKFWKWGMSGQPLKYEGFSRLDQSNTGLQWQCIIVDPKLQYKWNARKCFERKHYICQTSIGRKHLDDNMSDNRIPNVGFKRDSRRQDDSVGDVSPGHLKKKKPHKTQTKVLRNLSCPKPFIRIRKHCYLFSTITASWQDAFFHCKEEHNATLAVVDTLQDDKGLLNNINRHYIPKNESESSGPDSSGEEPQAYKDRWIGGRYDWKQHLWTWEDTGKRIPYQSKESQSLEFHCLTWNPKIKTRPRWNSDSCVNQKYFICETPIIHVYKVPKNLKSKGKLNVTIEFGINGKVLQKKTYRTKEVEGGMKGENEVFSIHINRVDDYRPNLDKTNLDKPIMIKPNIDKPNVDQSYVYYPYENKPKVYQPNVYNPKLYKPYAYNSYAYKPNVYKES